MSENTAMVERWEDDTDEEYADRVRTRRAVDAARSRYEQSQEYRDNKARTAAYNASIGRNSMAERPSLQEQLAALNDGAQENTAVLRAGLGLDTTPEARAWAEAKLAEQDPYAQQELDLRGKYGQGVRDTVARLRAARERLAAQKPDKADFWLAFTQGAAQPNMGGKLGFAGNIAEAVRPALANQRAFTDEQRAGLDAYDTAIEGAQRGETDLELKLLQERRKAWDAERLRAAQILGKNVPGAKGSAAGNNTFNKESAKQYIDWLTREGPNNMRTQSAFQGAIDRINRAKADGKNISGRDSWAGIASLFGDTLGDKVTSIADPLASDISNDVRNIVQLQLRPTLGAQFTENEGERLMRRAYDPLKPEEVNIARIQTMLTVAQQYAAASDSMAEWFEMHDGDMSGYKMPREESARLEQDMLTAMAEAEVSLGLKRDDDTLPPGTIRFTPENKKKKNSNIIGVDRSKQNKKKGFWDRVFAKGGSVQNMRGFQEGGQDDRIAVEMPDGSIVYFKAGTPPKEIQTHYDAEVKKLERREALINLGAGATAAGAGAAGSYGLARMMGGAAERMPYSPMKISSGERRFVDAANRDDVDLFDTAKALRELQDRRAPAIALDALPAESRGLINEAMRTGSGETKALQEQLSGRNLDARSNRLPDAVMTATKAEPYLEQMRALESARATQATPLYEALNNDPWVKERVFDRIPTKAGGEHNFIDWMYDTPVGKEAFDRAEMKWTVNKANAGKSPVRLNAVNRVTGYDINYLNHVKQALDDIEADATGKGYSAGDVAKIRRRFLEQLDAVRPDYQAARSAFADASKPITALRVGRGDSEALKDLTYQDVDGRMVHAAKGYLDMRPEETERYLSGIGKGEELKNLRSGVAEALVSEMRNKTSGNPARTMLDNPDRMAAIEALLDENDFNEFKSKLEAEAELHATSDEFGRKAESARGKARGAPISTGRKAGKLTGEAAKTVVTPWTWMYKIFVPGKAETGNPERTFKQQQADDIVKIASIRRAEDIERLARAAGRRATRGRRAGKAAIIGGLAAAGKSVYDNLAEDDEDEELE